MKGSFKGFATFLLLALSGDYLVSAQENYSYRMAFQWSPNPDTNLTGYYLYIGNFPRRYLQRLNVGNQTTYEVADLVPGVPYFFAITAYNSSALESNLSREIGYLLPVLRQVQLGSDPQKQALQVSFDRMNNSETYDYDYFVEYTYNFQQWFDSLPIEAIETRDNGNGTSTVVFEIPINPEEASYKFARVRIKLTYKPY